MPADEIDEGREQRYEAVFCLFLVAIAVLWRENADLAYPQILYLLLLLLGLNLAAGWRLRRTAGRGWTSAAIVLANCAAITAILAYSGGQRSNLWVLYLLPIYTACMLLTGREVAWITAGVVSFNTAFNMLTAAERGAVLYFGLAVKTGILCFAGAATWRIARRDRGARQTLRARMDELRRLEAELRAGAEREAQAERIAEVGWLASGVAHDLNNTLYVIRGTAEILSSQPGLPADWTGELGRILRAVQMGQRMLAGLLLRAGQGKPRLEAVDPAVALEAALSLLAPRLAAARVTVEVERAARPRALQADREMLERIFLNLISNAAAAMKDGGSLRVRLAPDPDPGRLRLEFVDTGPGIPEALLPKLFKPFPGGRSDEGHGLGLYLCAEIARKHGAEIRAENQPGGGARVTLVWPCAAAVPA